MRTLSPVQLALVFSLLGSLALVAVPAFVSNLHASRLAEPIEGLSHIGSVATMLAAGAPPDLGYPSSVPRTPSQVPAGEPVRDPPRTWDHPSWRALGFSFDRPHFFAFEFSSQFAGSRATFFASAYGDLDGDGVLSRIRLAGERKDGDHPRTYPLLFEREIE